MSDAEISKSVHKSIFGCLRPSWRVSAVFLLGLGIARVTTTVGADTQESEANSRVDAATETVPTAPTPQQAWKDAQGVVHVPEVHVAGRLGAGASLVATRHEVSP